MITTLKGLQATSRTGPLTLLNSPVTPAPAVRMVNSWPQVQLKPSISNTVSSPSRLAAPVTSRMSWAALPARSIFSVPAAAWVKSPSTVITPADRPGLTVPLLLSAAAWTSPVPLMVPSLSTPAAVTCPPSRATVPAPQIFSVSVTVTVPPPVTSSVAVPPAVSSWPPT